MFYEGTEKRLEIIVKPANLLALPESFWKELVTRTGALILSKIENTHICAYLLSESSLFVWPDRFLLITCGNTHLVKAAQFFQQHHPKEQLKALLFQRHQAIQPTLQKSNFQQDSLQLNMTLQGIQKHWQDAYQGDLFFFGKLTLQDLNNKHILMMHGLSGAFAALLHSGKASTEDIESKLALEHFFSYMLIDQFTFSPKGYSLNAISQHNYLTIHITPEKLSSYLSLETNFTLARIKPFITHLIGLLNPLKSQLMHFTNNHDQGIEVSVTKAEDLVINTKGMK